MYHVMLHHVMLQHSSWYRRSSDVYTRITTTTTNNNNSNGNSNIRNTRMSSAVLRNVGSRDMPWLRTNGVNSNWVAAKVINFGGLGDNWQILTEWYPTSTSVEKNINFAVTPLVLTPFVPFRSVCIYIYIYAYTYMLIILIIMYYDPVCPSPKAAQGGRRRPVHAPRHYIIFVSI